MIKFTLTSEQVAKHRACLEAIGALRCVAPGENLHIEYNFSLDYGDLKAKIVSLRRIFHDPEIVPTADLEKMKMLGRQQEALTEIYKALIKELDKKANMKSVEIALKKAAEMKATRDAQEAERRAVEAVLEETRRALQGHVDATIAAFVTLGFNSCITKTVSALHKNGGVMSSIWVERVYHLGVVRYVICYNTSNQPLDKRCESIEAFDKAFGEAMADYV